ncbi:hypothetical protein [Janthinobacterium sp. UMAB-56]|uniref:hypothetical protein n=1 Tax=Janthinobacterium sp. UMAB-56 TaxID=1365361 RepID=UPI001C5A07D4|nr:hypothetical protein [Janthinobacterium sp. UMAB-56]
MNYGLQVLDADEHVVFDSYLAAGGVCLGIFEVPHAGAVFTFPDMGGDWRGFSINLVGRNVAGMTYDNALGYPRFTFDDLNWGRVVALLVK